MMDDGRAGSASRLRLLIMIAAVPILGFLVAETLPRSGTAPWLAWQLLDHLPMATLAFGIILVILIKLAGLASAGKRELLLWLFRPGLYVTVAALAGLVIVHAAILVAVLLVSIRALFWSYSIAAGALAGIAAMFRGVFALVQEAEPEVFGIGVGPAEAPRLWERVKQLAERMDALVPQHIVLGYDPNFFVTEANVKCLNGQLRGRTLFCSVPLARILTTAELGAIVAHELAHFKGADIQFSKKFYPIYRGTASALEGAASVGQGEGVPFALLPAVAVLSYFMETFALAERRVSRHRELAADEEATRITSPRTAASALVKTHAFAPAWYAMHPVIVEGLRHRSMFLDLSALYAEGVGQLKTTDLLEVIGESHLEHPTDSHPSLRTRLEALGLTLDDVTPEGLTTAVSDPAISLVDKHSRLERKLTIAYQQLLAQQFGIDLDRLPREQRPKADSYASRRLRERRRAAARRRRP